MLRHSKFLQFKMGAAIVAGLMLLAGPVASADSSPADGTPVRGGILKFAVQSAPKNIDPHNGSSSFSEGLIIVNISDKLVYQDPATGKLEPWLATKWTTNTDSTKFDFTLREDVTFSDGSPLTADVVKKNFDLLGFGDKALGVIPVATFWTNYVGTTVTGKYTFTVEMSQSNIGFVQALSHYYSGIVGLKTLSMSAADRLLPQNIIGSGPFTVTEQTYNVRTVMTRRAGYNWAPPSLKHQGEAYLDKVEVDVIPEPSVRTGALQSGDIDATLDVNLTDEKVLKSSGYQVVSQIMQGYDLSGFMNVNLAPTNELAVRQALVLGLDRKALKNNVLTDSYEVSTSIISSKIAGYVDHSADLRYDPTEGKKLLDAAGWKVGADGIRVKDGKPLVVRVLKANLLVTDRDMLDLMTENMRQIGIKLDVNLVPDVGALLAARAVGGWNLDMGNQSRDSVAVMEQVLSPTQNNKALLKQGDPYYSKALELFKQLNATQSDAETAKVAGDIQKWAIDSELSLPLISLPQVIAASKNVHGIVFEPHARALFYSTWLSKP